VFDGMRDGQPTGHGDDTGSSSLGMYRAGKQLGVISRVEWAFGLRHALEAMVANRRPGALGIPWRAGMMTPDSDGRIHYTGAPSRAVTRSPRCACGSPTNAFTSSTIG
jgi:hypothetical protein